MIVFLLPRSGLAEGLAVSALAARQIFFLGCLTAATPRRKELVWGKVVALSHRNGATTQRRFGNFMSLVTATTPRTQRCFEEIFSLFRRSDARSANMFCESFLSC
mgnify:CR=1 FL=1